MKKLFIISLTNIFLMLSLISTCSATSAITVDHFINLYNNININQKSLLITSKIYSQNDNKYTLTIASKKGYIKVNNNVETMEIYIKDANSGENWTVLTNSLIAMGVIDRMEIFKSTERLMKNALNHSIAQGRMVRGFGTCTFIDKPTKCSFKCAYRFERNHTKRNSAETCLFTVIKDNL